MNAGKKAFLENLKDFNLLERETRPVELHVQITIVLIALLALVAISR